MPTDKERDALLAQVLEAVNAGQITDRAGIVAAIIAAYGDAGLTITADQINAEGGPLEQLSALPPAAPAIEAPTTPPAVIQPTVPTPAVLPALRNPALELTGGGTQTRGDLFAEQGAEDFRRRVLAEQFGESLSPTAARGARTIFNRFSDIDPLLEFQSPGQTAGQRFGGFAGGAAPDIGLGINELLGSENLLDFVPDFETAARLGLQEGLAGVNPRLRRRAQERLLTEFGTQRAQRPEEFQEPSAENLSRQIEAFRRRRFAN